MNNLDYFEKYIDHYGFLGSPSGGDETWLSSWYFFACSVHNYKPENIEKFLSSFYMNCVKEDKIITHPAGKSNPFSRDQLSPLLLLLASVHKYQPQYRIVAKPIIEAICKLDDRQGNLDIAAQCDINDNLRYPIGKVADLYVIKYSSNKPDCYFVRTIQMYHMLWSYMKKDKWMQSWIYRMIQKKFGVKIKAMPRPYTIWNSLGLLTMIAIIRGKENSEVASWRPYFEWYGKNGWGPAYKIVSGKAYGWNDVDWYKNHKTNRLNIVQQRGSAHKSSPELGSILCLDYPILKALEKVWG